MSKIKVEWLADEHNCETCGWTMAEGACVYVDGELVLDMTPTAHCFGGETWDSDQVWKRLLQHLGHEVEFA